MKQSLSERYLKRFGHQYILLMMIVTRLGGSIGGLLVIYYVELTLRLPAEIRYHFRISAIVVVIQCVTSTVLIALWELRRVRHVLRCIERGEPFDPAYATQAGQDAVLFPDQSPHGGLGFTPLHVSCCFRGGLYAADWGTNARHRLPCSLNFDVGPVFMGINSGPVGATSFAVEHCYGGGDPAPCWLTGVWRSSNRIRCLGREPAIPTRIVLVPDHHDDGPDDRPGRPAAGNRPRRRPGRNSPKGGRRSASCAHSAVHHAIAAAITGVLYATLMAGSVTKRVDVMVAAMDRVGGGLAFRTAAPTGNDEIDILARQFNSDGRAAGPR